MEFPLRTVRYCEITRHIVCSKFHHVTSTSSNLTSTPPEKYLFSRVLCADVCFARWFFQVQTPTINNLVDEGIALERHLELQNPKWCLGELSLVIFCRWICNEYARWCSSTGTWMILMVLFLRFLGIVFQWFRCVWWDHPQLLGTPVAMDEWGVC